MGRVIGAVGSLSSLFYVNGTEIIDIGERGPGDDLVTQAFKKTMAIIVASESNAQG